MSNVDDVAAQTVESRHWHGATATIRQSEQVVAGTLPEWRSLWGRVGIAPPENFEPGRHYAVGIFLGRRNSEGYSVNIISASRRRDRIVIVFEERMPPDIMTAQRTSPTVTRPVSNAPGVPGLSGPGFGGPGAGFAAPGAAATLPPPPPLGTGIRPPTQPTSPWAIVLINRADLPVSVEQRLFR
ncbi:MAG: protease complex subunit PrcB family protein [Reyranellaceae bacterium]